MSHARDLPARPSLDSLRKQAKRLARDAAAGHGEAIARIHAQMPGAELPLSNRDAQLVIAREYGFAGWPALSAEVQKRIGGEIDWAVSQARVAIHDENHERLRTLLADYPVLISWRDETGQSLLDATTSYAMDCSDPERERTYTRPTAAEILIDAGAVVERTTWEDVIKTGASGMLHLLARRNALPQTLQVLAALGDDAMVRALLEESRGPSRAEEVANEQTRIHQALMTACRFRHTGVARRLLERAIALDPELGRRIDRWHSGDGRQAFVDFLERQPSLLWQDPQMVPWETFVVLQLARARDRGDLSTFRRWLDDESWVLQPSFIHVQAELMLPACYEKDRETFIAALLERDPAILRADPPPRSTHIIQALSYGNAHIVPLLTRIWPLPNDLPHAAGLGDAAAVAGWFDAGGHPALGALAHHYPASDPQFPRADLHWGPPTTQQVLDVALAWAVLNRHFDIATFLLERGADVNTDWATHEPASILHEAAIQGNDAAVRFLIDRGADLTMTDYRYESTAEGWARYGSRDEPMANLLAAAAANGSAQRTQPRHGTA
ncbi:MAG TPA: ankyrin repeat domain-containing protein [Gemmatimonadaceae bacterium]|nr:ankyrin repeat domain-containing protein [Gemmatimonadaceae bacterium]